MKRCATLLSLLFAATALFAQTGYVTVNATNLRDSSGVLVPDGTIVYWAPVTQTQQPTSYQVNGQGQTINTPVSVSTVNGGFTLTIADTQATTPTNVCFLVTAKTSTYGTNILGPGYTCVQPHNTAVNTLDWCAAGVCNFDNYRPGDVFPQYNNGVLINGNPCYMGGAPCSISASQITTGKLPHAQLPTLVAGDIPDNNANTTGNAATATNAANAPNALAKSNNLSDLTNAGIARTNLGLGSAATQPSTAFDAAGAAAAAQAASLPVVGGHLSGAVDGPSANFTHSARTTFSPTGYYAYGDSIDYCYGSGITSTLNCFWQKIASQLGITNSNLRIWGLSGTQACDVWPSQFVPAADGGETGSASMKLRTFESFANDVTFGGGGGGGQTGPTTPPFPYTATQHTCYEATAAWAAVPTQYQYAGVTYKTKILGNDAAVATTGTCANDTVYSAVSTGKSCTASGSVITVPFTTTVAGPVYIWVRYIDGDTGAWTYDLDNGATTAQTTALPTPIITNGANTASVGLIRIPSVTAGAHTLHMTQTANGTMGFIALGFPPPIVQSAKPWVVLFDGANQLGNGNQLAVDAYRAQIQAIGAELQGDGLNVETAPLSKHIQASAVASDSLGIHWTDLGHQEAFDAFMDVAGAHSGQPTTATQINLPCFTGSGTVTLPQGTNCFWTNNTTTLTLPNLAGSGFSAQAFDYPVTIFNSGGCCTLTLAGVVGGNAPLTLAGGTTTTLHSTGGGYWYLSVPSFINTSSPQLTVGYDATHLFTTAVNANGLTNFNIPAGQAYYWNFNGVNTAYLATNQFFMAPLGTATVSNNYNSGQFGMRASGWVGGAAVAHQTYCQLGFDVSSGTASYAKASCALQAGTLPLIWAWGGYLDFSLQASSAYTLNHQSDTWWCTDTLTPCFYNNANVRAVATGLASDSWTDGDLLLANGSNVYKQIKDTGIAASSLVKTIASGTSAMGTGAITSGTCATVVTTTATGALTTDKVQWSFNAAPGVGWPSLSTPRAYLTAGNINWLVCNPSAGSVTPAAATINWSVTR